MVQHHPVLHGKTRSHSLYVQATKPVSSALIAPRKIRSRPARLAVRRIHCDAVRELPLPAVAVRKQSFLVVIEFFTGFRGELEIRTFDDRIDRARFLAETAINALHHVNVVAHRAARAVIAAWASLDRDRLRRADRLAQLARDTALFAVWIAAQRMLAPETRR